MTAAAQAEVDVHLSITGRVQGVGFRDALMAQARALQARGWVRNRHDGSVEAVLRAPAPSLAALTAWARRGPPAAHVERVEQRAASAAESALVGAGFARLPSA